MYLTVMGQAHRDKDKHMRFTVIEQTHTKKCNSLEHPLMGGPGRCLSGIERLNKTRLGVKVGEKETSSEAHGLRAVDTWGGALWWEHLKWDLTLWWKHL